MEQQYSNIFGWRKYRMHYINEDFCNKFYDLEAYDILVSQEDAIKNYINDHLRSYIELYKKEGTLSLFQDQIDKLAEHYAGQYFDTDVEPNGKMKYPDYIIHIGKWRDVYVDAKCVAYIPRKTSKNNQPILKYNNACGQIKEVVNNILAYYRGEDNKFYKSFIIFIYYNEDGYVEDILFCPTIYALKLKNFDWNDLDSFNFNTKGTKNLNVTIGLPSFLVKNGMMTLEEKELSIATAAHNYIEKHPEEFNNG